MAKNRIPRKKKKNFLSKPVMQWIRAFNRYGRKIDFRGYIIKSKADFEQNSWGDYYHDGYSPKEALNEDLSYGF